MIFQVTSGDLCEQIEATNRDEAIDKAFKGWDGNQHLSTTTACETMIGEKKTRWTDTLVALSKLSIKYRIDGSKIFTII